MKTIVTNYIYALKSTLRTYRKIFNRPLKVIIVSISIIMMVGCTLTEPTEFQQVETYPSIFPDYVGVTIPANIAPLRFKLSVEADDALAVISRGNNKLCVPSKGGSFLIDESDWKQLLTGAEGDSLLIKVYAEQQGNWKLYRPFIWKVAPDPVDPYLAYRLIEPGYELWNRMGIYQRDLTSFDEEPIIHNERTGNNCMNCHTFNQQSPDTIMFHQRAQNGGTYIVSGDKVDKIDAKLGKDFNGIVYPSWHPSGKFIAFSSNKIRQSFARAHRNRVEVYDLESDLVIYDVARHEILSDSLVSGKASFETFPTFSPDGKKLYFCSARAVTMPQNYQDVHYNLCSVNFDADARKIFGKVDTIVSVMPGKKSVSFPRVSPDGKNLVFVLSDFGNFSIWHREADLYMINLQTGKMRALEEINSKETESFHTWSSTGKWMVFSSRRIDGLYTHPYISYLQSDGTFSKPFVLPQRDPNFYRYYMKSFNLPEFLKGKVEIDSSVLWKATREKGIKLKWAESDR